MIMKFIFSRVRQAGALLLSAMLFAPLFAHADVEASSATAAPAAAPEALEELVVTAQKRVQNVNDVGLSIAVLGSDALRERHISSLADLASAVPGLSYTQSVSARSTTR
jgi:outer membrane receptor protein involved in Fe transport